MHKKTAEEAFIEYQNKKKKALADNALFVKGGARYYCLRPFLRLVLKIQRLVNRQTVVFIHKPEKVKSEKPVIFVVTHIGKWDFEIVNEWIRNPFIVLASDFINTYRKIGGLFMAANGVIFVNERSREDKANTKRTAQRALEDGHNLMIFPEGTWNLTENEIVRDIHYGTVDLAIRTGALLYPIAVEQYGKNFVINAGSLMSVVGFEKETANILLRDTLASLKYEIWERQGITQRNSLSEDYWEQFIAERLKEWSGYSMEEQVINTFTPKVKKEQAEVERDLERVRRNRSLSNDTKDKRTPFP